MDTETYWCRRCRRLTLMHHDPRADIWLPQSEPVVRQAGWVLVLCSKCWLNDHEAQVRADKFRRAREIFK